MKKEEIITVKFNIMGETTSWPVQVNKNGSVMDLITACSKVCNIPPSDLNIRDLQKNFVRAAQLSYYRVKEGDTIIGAKKYVYVPPQNGDQHNESKGSNEEDKEDDDDDEDEDKDSDLDAYKNNEDDDEEEKKEEKEEEEKDEDKDKEKEKE